MADKAAFGAAFQDPAMLGALQNCLGSLVGQSSGYVENLPKIVKKRCQALKNLQDEHSKFEAEFRDEILALEKKFLLKYQPLYDKRAQIVNGEIEPSEEETQRPVDADPELVLADDEENKESTSEETSSVGVPEFWLTVFKNQPTISEIVTEKDEEALKSLQDIRISYLDNNPGFRLEFIFAENPFFTNKTLTKTYFLENSANAAFGDVMYDHAEGCTIDWKEGKDLSVTIEIKKQRHKNTKQTRTIKKTVPSETFFTFFNPPKAPEEDVEIDEEELQEFDAQLEADYDIGEIIKQKLIPRAVDWFTGKALEYEEGELDDDEDYYPEDGGDDEGENDDEESEGDEADGDENANAAKTPECKQQ